MKTDPTHPSPGPLGQPESTLAGGLCVLAGLMGVAIVLATLLEAGVHLFDRSRIEHVSGVWIVLADAVSRDGVGDGLYPSLRSEDGARLGGTRYMPLGILATAGATSLTGDAPSAGKLVSLTGAAMMTLAMTLMMRLARVPWWGIAGLVGLVIGTEPGQIAALTARQEAWPVALQLMAVWLGLRSRATGALMLAAGLSVAAWLFKLTAVWAPVALGLWWLFTNRRAWLIYCLSYFGIAIVALGLLHWISQGRMAETLLGLGGAGLKGSGGPIDQLMTSITRLAGAITTDAPAVWALGGLALAAMVMPSDRRWAGAMPIAWVVSGLVLVALFADIGIASNHLIDFACLSALLAAGLIAQGQLSPASDEREGSSLESNLGSLHAKHSGHAVLAGVIVWSGGAMLVLSQARGVLIAAKQLARGGTPEPWSTPTPFEGRFDIHSRVLLEDPSLWLTIGQRPEFTDPFMLPLLLAREPSWGEGIIERLKTRAYEAVVLIRPIELEPMHYERVHLGPAIAAAIVENYTLESVDAGNRHIYRPKQEALP
jgi:hypothetical protein